MSGPPNVGVAFLGRLRQPWFVFHNQKASVYSKFNTQGQRLLSAVVSYRHMYVGLAASRRDFDVATMTMH